MDPSETLKKFEKSLTRGWIHRWDKKQGSNTIVNIFDEILTLPAKKWRWFFILLSRIAKNKQKSYKKVAISTQVYSAKNWISNF